MTWAALIEAAEVVRGEVAGREPVVAELRLAAIGWSTVEHERAERELGEILAPEDAAGSGGSQWVPLAP